MKLHPFLLLPILLFSGELRTAERPERPPFPTGVHLQLTRRVYTTENGLPSDDIRALAVARDGTPLAVAGEDLVALREGSWERMAVPGARSLHGPAGDADAIAGAEGGVWTLAGGVWTREEGSPPNAVAFSVDAAGTLWVLAPGGVFRRGASWERVHRLDESMGKPRGLCALGPDDVYAATERGLFGLMGKRKYWLEVEVRTGGLLSGDVRAVSKFGPDHLLAATDRGLNLTNLRRGWHAFTGENGLPVLDLTGVAVAEDGTVWVGSEEGLARWREGSWTYLAGKRWLPDNRVRAIAVGPDGSLWAATPGGLSHIAERPMTLEEKAETYQRDLELRDRRHGYVTIQILSEPGKLEGARQEISDNDGLWTALYIASQSFRYAVTRSPEALEQARRSMRALLRLERITGIPGFPARAVCRESEPETESLRSNPEWRPSPVEEGWWWKGDTSSDELDGHFFAFHVYWELAASEEEKREVRATCRRIMDHILDHGYRLVDADGKPTTWGVWAPEKLNDDPRWWEERGLNSLEILSHLKVALRVVGEPRYEEAYRDLIERHHYAINALHAKVSGGVSHDDQLAFLAYYPLLQLERDPPLRALYLASLERTWSYERAEANPLWNFIYGASAGGEYDVEAAVRSLREMPLDLVDWRMKNSHRADLRFDPDVDARGVSRLLRPLSLIERPLHKWDASPYILDGGSDRVEIDQTQWLLPYWLGRFHRLIESQDRPDRLRPAAR